MAGFGIRAQLELGYMCIDGKVAGSGIKEALKWFKQAAKQENADAQFALGCIYEIGSKPDVEKNEIKAFFGIKKQLSKDMQMHSIK